MYGPLLVKFSTCLLSSICFISKVALQLAAFNYALRKANIAVSLAFKTGKIIKVRVEWKNDSTKEEKCVESSIPLH
jgi:hypothetical protein